MLNKFLAQIREGFMPFNRQSWNGYSFRLSHGSFIKTVLTYFYHLPFINFTNRHISFDLFVYPPKHRLDSIEYEWDIYDKTTNSPIALDAKPKRTGIIEFRRVNSKIKALCDGEYLDIVWDTTQFKIPYYYRLKKAVNMGYVVNNIKYYIKIKFRINGESFESEPMASFNLYDSEDWLKFIIELVIATSISVIITQHLLK